MSVGGALSLALALVVAAAPLRAQDAPVQAPATDAAPATTPPAEGTVAPADAAPADAAPADAAPAPDAAPNADAAPATTEPAQATDATTVDATVAEPAAETSDEPSIEERRIVAYVATGVAVASLAVGITFGVLAQQQYQCVADVLECNKTLDDPITGAELFDARAEVEHKALIADMAYLFAAASALVATTGYLRGFVWTGEEETPDTTSSIDAPPRAPALADALAASRAEQRTKGPLVAVAGGAR